MARSGGRIPRPVRPAPHRVVQSTARVYNQAVQRDRAGWVVAVVLGAVLAAAPVAGDDQLSLTNLSGEVVDPWSADPAGVSVFIFTGTECPISNRYAPELRRIYEAFHARGVAFWLVYADAHDTPDMIRAHREAYGHPMPALRDLEHALVGLTEATVTPEVVVFGPGRELRYRGRIDDWYVAFGKSRPRPTQHDLRDALDAVLAGRPVPEPRTHAIGCYIPPVDY